MDEPREKACKIIAKAGLIPAWPGPFQTSGALARKPESGDKMRR
ncbi:MAG TPA: hypothetical protein VG742_04595 [Dongiaceae bacterium]|nr:hypothetical protein [Dongiaceae bacterium]